MGEHSLPELQKKWNELLDNSLEMIIFFDREGRVIEGNQLARQELGYGDNIEGISLGRIFQQIMVYQEGRVVISDEQVKQLAEEHKTIETVAYRKNQTCFDVDLKLVYRDEEDFFGMCIFVNTAVRVGAIKDMVKAKERVEDATKIRNEFVSNVTHELRTPVNGILGLSRNLLETELDEQQKESVNIIHMCCQNMISIINNLLDFSKLEAGKFTLEEREFDFREALDKIIAINMNQINEKGLKLLLNISPEIPERIVGDELRITQILTNLINNAVKFTSVGQIVVDVVKTMELNDTVELFFMVMDTGIGIAPEDMDKLFKSFSQVDASITRRFGGSGLGLTIVKELVELMDGEIHVESEKGRGSTFSFSIRVKRADSSFENTKAYETGKFVYEGFSRHEVKNMDDEMQSIEEIYRLGSDENKKEITNTMEKLIICVEMENWEKAEMFAGTMKKLLESDKELKRKAFRLEMTVRKADGESALTQYNDLDQALKEAQLQE